jgi:hypothetical protein
MPRTCVARRRYVRTSQHAEQMAGGTLFDAGAGERQPGVHQRRTRVEIVGHDYGSNAAGASADRNEIVVLHVLGDKEVLAGLTSLLLCRVSIDFSLESRLFCYLDAVARLVRRLHRRSDVGLRTGSVHGVARGRYRRRQSDEAIHSVVVRK